jgi:hypothetical protein
MLIIERSPPLLLSSSEQLRLLVEIDYASFGIYISSWSLCIIRGLNACLSHHTAKNFYFYRRFLSLCLISTRNRDRDHDMIHHYALQWAQPCVFQNWLIFSMTRIYFNIGKNRFMWWLSNSIITTQSAFNSGQKPYFIAVQGAVIKVLRTVIKEYSFIAVVI